MLVAKMIESTSQSDYGIGWNWMGLFLSNNQHHSTMVLQVYHHILPSGCLT